MNNRGKILYVLAALLLLGFGFFLWEYINNAKAWATDPGAPHISGSATVTDRTGKVLTDTQDALLRQAMVHWLGDKSGNIRAPAAEIQRPYNFLNGLYSYGGFRPKIRLTLQAELQKAALSALGEHRGTIAIFNFETGEILCAVSAPTFDPENPGDTVESMFHLTSQIARPYYDASLGIKVLDFTERLLKSVPIYCLTCNISEEAVETVFREIFPEEEW